MKQPFHPSSSALRTLIAAVIMIIASATMAWAQEIGGGGEIILDAIRVPLTLQATAECTITITNPRSGMQYSVDGGKKEEMAGTKEITVAANKTVRFYGKGTEIKSYFTSYSDYTNITCSADCCIYGNIMSLVDETNFATNTDLSEEGTFRELFKGNAHLISNSNMPLVLPATTLKKSCYQNMFRGCSSLTKAPALPATTLAERCYFSMFYGCTGLTEAPDLPATTLTESCYRGMFDGCTGLTKAPDLPATTLAKSCYGGMFYNCTKLSYVRCLATDHSASDCTTDWLYNVASSGTFVKAVNAVWNTGTSGIPEGWTKEEDMLSTPLTLQATADGTITVSNPRSGMQYSIDYGEKTLMTGTTTIDVTAEQTVQFYGSGTDITAYYASDTDRTRFYCSANCYIYGNIMSLVDETDFATNTRLPAENTFRELFYNNKHLINHPTYSLVLPATSLKAYCYDSMFEGCSGLTSASKLPATTLRDHCYASMFSGCTRLASAPKLPATTMKDYCYDGMFLGCTRLTTAPDLPATTMKDYCYDGMFLGCTSLTTAPDLPATTLAENCYAYMFEGCANLTTAPNLPAKTLAESCYRAMFSGCTKLSYVECLATDISAEKCTKDWLHNVASSGTFIKAANTNWSIGISGIPGGWTVRDSGGLTLYDNGKNKDAVKEKNKKKVSYVVLAGRTLYRDGTWNTLCLPFDVSGEDNTDGITFKGTPLEGATVKTLTAASFSNGILTLNFGPDVTTITAGKPYVIKWETGTENTKLNSPVFDNVTIKKGTTDVTIDGVVTFIGTYDSKTYDAEKRSNLLLDADRSPLAGSTTTLQYATSGTRLGAFRAYFTANQAVMGSDQSPLTDCVLDFGNNETLTCPFVERGDANGDGTISVTDIAVVVNCILGLPTTGGYSPGGADANGDGDISVTDIGVIVDKILGGKK